SRVGQRGHALATATERPDTSGRSGPPGPLGELARRWNQRLFLADRFQELVLVVLDREDELAQERLVVFLPDRLVALREVVALLDLHALQGLDQVVRVLAAAIATSACRASGSSSPRSSIARSGPAAVRTDRSS